MARDAELLGLLRDANFISVFIGIESPRKESLAETRKTQNERLDLLEAIHKIQAHNLFISAGVIGGVDHRDATPFDGQVRFPHRFDMSTTQLDAVLARRHTHPHLRYKSQDAA